MSRPPSGPDADAAGSQADARLGRQPPLVRVQVIGWLIGRLGWTQRTLPLAPGLTVGQALGQLALPPDLPTLVTCNGARAEPQRPLADGDRLMIAPFYSGG